MRFVFFSLLLRWRGLHLSRMGTLPPTHGPLLLSSRWKGTWDVDQVMELTSLPACRESRLLWVSEASSGTYASSRPTDTAAHSDPLEYGTNTLALFEMELGLTMTWDYFMMTYSLPLSTPRLPSSGTPMYWLPGILCIIFGFQTQNSTHEPALLLSLRYATYSAFSTLDFLQPIPELEKERLHHLRHPLKRYGRNSFSDLPFLCIWNTIRMFSLLSAYRSKGSLGPPRWTTT